jgi:SulP family sulfate permease
MPARVSFYEVNGPLFFGAAQNAMATLHASHADAFHTLILNLAKVPVIDATGFAALENAIEELVKRKKAVILVGPLPRPQSIFEKARLGTKHGKLLQIAPDLETALKMAREIDPPPPSVRTQAVTAGT